MTLDELKQKILTKGYHEVAFDVPHEQIEKAIAAYFDFLTLPEEQKERWAFQIKLDEEDRGTELGQYRRQSTDGSFLDYDDKAFFHYNSEVKRRFRNHPEVPKELIAFLDAAEPLYLAAAEAIEKILLLFKDDYPPLAEPFSHLSVLRFLKYERAPAGEFLARGHYDRGACTLAIAESAPGLRIGPSTEDLQEVRHTVGNAFFFPALFMQEKTGGDFPASWHDVVQRSEDVFRADTARWAIVFFAVPPEASYFSREITHGSKT